MSCYVGEVTERLENELERILQLFRHFTYVTVHSPTLLSRYLRQPTFPSLRLRHSSFANPSVALPMSQLIIQPFRCFTYFTAHSPTLLPLYPRHSSFSNLSVVSPMSQLILKPFFRFSHVTGSSFTSPGESPMIRTLKFPKSPE